MLPLLVASKKTAVEVLDHCRKIVNSLVAGGGINECSDPLFIYLLLLHIDDQVKLVHKPLDTTLPKNPGSGKHRIFPTDRLPVVVTPLLKSCMEEGLLLLWTSGPTPSRRRSEDSFCGRCLVLENFEDKMVV